MEIEMKKEAAQKLVKILAVEPCRDYTKRPDTLETPQSEAGTNYSIEIKSVRYRRIVLSYQNTALILKARSSTVYDGGIEKNVMVVSCLNKSFKIRMLYMTQEDILRNLAEYLDMLFDMPKVSLAYTEFCSNLVNVVPLALFGERYDLSDFYQHSRQKTLELLKYRTSARLNAAFNQIDHSTKDASDITSIFDYPYCDLDVGVFTKEKLLSLMPPDLTVDKEKFNKNLTLLQLSVFNAFVQLYLLEYSTDEPFTLYSGNIVGTGIIAESSCAGVRPNIHNVGHLLNEIDSIA
jgi:hypothetical protein